MIAADAPTPIPFHDDHGFMDTVRWWACLTVPGRAELADGRGSGQQEELSSRARTEPVTIVLEADGDDLIAWCGVAVDDPSAAHSIASRALAQLQPLGRLGTVTVHPDGGDVFPQAVLTGGP